MDAGFSIERVDIFDKQHGTFKQFVSDNTAGCDLMLHCRKVQAALAVASPPTLTVDADMVRLFLGERQGAIPKLSYLHVRREDGIDYRMLYSEFLTKRLTHKGNLIDFATFRALAASLLEPR
jgi:hypothetical protein